MTTTTVSGRIPFIGDRVRVVAADEFYAYCDGWEGTVQGLNNGAVEVHCEREDGNKVLFVKPAELAMLD